MDRLIVMFAAVMCAVAAHASPHPQSSLGQQTYWRHGEILSWQSFIANRWTPERRSIRSIVIDRGWPSWMEEAIGLARLQGADGLIVGMPFGSSGRGELRLDEYLHLLQLDGFDRVTCMRGILLAAQTHYEEFGRPWVWYLGSMDLVHLSYRRSLASLAPVLAADGKIAVVFDASATRGIGSVDWAVIEHLRGAGVDVAIEAAPVAWHPAVSRTDIAVFMLSRAHADFTANRHATLALDYYVRGPKYVLQERLNHAEMTTAEWATLFAHEDDARLGRSHAIVPWDWQHGRVTKTVRELAELSSRPPIDPPSDDEEGR